MPVHLCIGNHDDRGTFLDSFPEYLGEHGFAQHVFELSEGYAITLDTWGDATHAGHFCEKRADWLSTQLASLPGPIWVFMHHNPVATGVAPMDKIMLLDAKRFKDTITPYKDKVAHIFHGHCHLPLSGNVAGVSFSAPRGTNHAGWPDFAAERLLSASDLPEAYNVIFAGSENTMCVTVEYGYDGDIRAERLPRLCELGQNNHDKVAAAIRTPRNSLFMTYRRYAVYDLPHEPGLATSGSAWLGWDAISGQPAQQPDYSGIDAITETPRKYGFHATLKPPFRLAASVDETSLIESVSILASSTAPVVNDRLKVSSIGKFLALTLKGNSTSVNLLAFKCVKTLEPFRAPLNDAELARRRASRLSLRQESLLQQWGYPYVDDEFNYHITLTGKLNSEALRLWHETATRYFNLPTPYLINSIALAGERADGQFELIERFQLTGRTNTTG